MPLALHLQRCNKMVVDGSRIFVEMEYERILPGWKPRRLGNISFPFCPCPIPEPDLCSVEWGLDLPASGWRGSLSVGGSPCRRRFGREEGVGTAAVWRKRTTIQEANVRGCDLSVLQRRTHDSCSHHSTCTASGFSGYIKSAYCSTAPVVQW